MAIRIFNTQTRTKETFEPLTPGEVRMYVCGPTVYNFLHVGNFRGPVFFNLVRNWLEHRGYAVKFVFNYTDVDDRIIQRANEENLSALQISERYIREFETDYQALGLRPHTRNPRVTEHMQDIIGFVSTLIENKKAYVVDGDVYFSVTDFSGYGKLSHRNLEELEAGARIEVDTRKKHPADFALWKSSKPGEPSWPSPWGEGRPGWHIECSAMIRALLGDTIDIHGGGLDLVFPHHENEIAQSEGCTGKAFVRYWMHNNMLELGAQKMSKSLGNIKTARSFMQEYNAEILKYMLLSAHYRSVLDFSEEQVQRAISSLAKFYSALAWAQDLIAADAPLAPVPAKFQEALTAADTGFGEALDDDFNSAEALARIFEVTRAFNAVARLPGKVRPEAKAAGEAYFHWVRRFGKLMSLFQEDPKSYLRILDDLLLEKKGLQREAIDVLVAERGRARDARDFARADELRQRLTEMGVSVMDGPGGSVWEVDKSVL